MATTSAPLCLNTCGPSFRQSLDALLRREALPQDKYGHQPRLYALTCAIGRDLSYDDDVVFAAAYLHDLGVFIGHRPEEPERLALWDHVAYTANRVPALLAQTDFPQEKIPAVLDAIRTHQPQDDPATIEATILRDADILEQLGAIGILRATVKVGRDTRYSSFTEAVAFLERSLEQLPGRIRLESTRELAQPRVEVLQAFLAATHAEAVEHLH